MIETDEQWAERMGRTFGSDSSAAPTRFCKFCGCLPHASIESCPAILRVEYYPDGTIKSVEKRP